jgi:hypothetical protein
VKGTSGPRTSDRKKEKNDIKSSLQHVLLVRFRVTGLKIT